MTYHSDPTRWSQSQLSSSDHGSELLRDAFSAGTREGPSDLQMRALALKLAAVGTGVAVTATAATAYGTQAGVAAAGGALKSAGAFTLSKLAVSIALVGAAATGAVFLQRGGEVPESSRAARQQVAQQAATPSSAADTAPAVAAPAVVAPAVAAPAQPKLTQARNAAPQADSVAPAAAVELTPRAQATELDTSVSEAPSSRSHHATRAERHAARSDSDSETDTHTKSSPSISIVSKSERVGGQQQLSEIELLRSARASLAARPREAYRLAEQHKEQYPEGVFAQERDALAVEALQRAGDLKLARQLAQAFVQRYPSSPHAHRFRETMGL